MTPRGKQSKNPLFRLMTGMAKHSESSPEALNSAGTERIKSPGSPASANGIIDLSIGSMPDESGNHRNRTNQAQWSWQIQPQSAAMGECPDENQAGSGCDWPPHESEPKRGERFQEHGKQPNGCWEQIYQTTHRRKYEFGAQHHTRNLRPKHAQYESGLQGQQSSEQQIPGDVLGQEEDRYQPHTDGIQSSLIPKERTPQ